MINADQSNKTYLKSWKFSKLPHSDNDFGDMITAAFLKIMNLSENVTLQNVKLKLLYHIDLPIIKKCCQYIPIYILEKK